LGAGLRGLGTGLRALGAGLRGLGAGLRGLGGQTSEPNHSSCKNIVKHEEKSKMTPKGAWGMRKNTCETRISAICTCFYVFLAIWPARGPAGKGGRGDRVNPIPPYRGSRIHFDRGSTDF